MINNFILILKGAIIGVANIVPGVSGGTLAITLGLYEKIISTINNFFKDFKNNLKFIISIGIGIGLGLLLVSKLIIFSLDNYPLPTNFFFIGLILGGLPIIFNKIKDKEGRISNFFILIFVFTFIIGLTFINDTNTLVSFKNLNFFGYFKLFIVGMIGAATMVIPGISGSFILMTLGYYKPILDTFNNLTIFYKLEFQEVLNNIFVLLPFGFGIIIGILLIAKLIEYFFQKFETKTYYAIIGFVLGSIIIILKPLLTIKLKTIIIVNCLSLFLLGFIIAYYLGERS